MMSAEARAAISARLEQLAASNGGRLTPELVIEDAKSEDSPLHQHFEWDQGKAAYSHWLEQARTLIRSVRVEIRTEVSSVTTVAYIRDPQAGDGEQGYVAVASLRDDKDRARDALVGEFSRVGDMLRRARQLAVALDAQGDVDDLLERVTGLRRRIMELPVQHQ